MNTIKTLLFITLACVASATEVRFNMADITGRTNNLPLSVQGMVMPFGSSNYVVAGFPIPLQPAGGTVTTNLVPGTYRLTVIGPSPAQTVDFNVTNSASVLDVRDLASFTLSKFSASQYLTTDQSDARYALKGEAGAGGITNSAVLYVDQSGSDATAMRSDPSKPWRTVIAALSNAVSGDVVRVGAGRWKDTEIGSTLPEGVTIAGAGRAATIFWSTNRLFDGTSLANNVTFRDLSWDFTGFIWSAAGNTNITWENCDIVSNWDIWRISSANIVRLLNCKIQSGYDMWLFDAGSSTNDQSNWLLLGCEVVNTGARADPSSATVFDCPDNITMIGGSITCGPNIAYIAQQQAWNTLRLQGVRIVYTGATNSTLFIPSANGSIELSDCTFEPYGLPSWQTPTAGLTIKRGELKVAQTSLLATNLDLNGLTKVGGVSFVQYDADRDVAALATTYSATMLGNNAYLTNLYPIRIRSTPDGDGAYQFSVESSGVTSARQLEAGTITATGAVTGLSFTGNGSGLTNLNLNGAVAVNGGLEFGVGMTNSSNYTLDFFHTEDGPGTPIATINASGFLGTFTGNGSGLTNLPAAQLTGTLPMGTLTAQSPVVTNGFLTTDGSARTYSKDGSALTNLNATQLLSGTVPTVRLPSTWGSVTNSGTGTAVYVDSTGIGVGGARVSGGLDIQTTHGQLYLGNSNRAGYMLFRRGTDGINTGRFGWASATNGSIFVLDNGSSSGHVRIGNTHVSSGGRIIFTMGTNEPMTLVSPVGGPTFVGIGLTNPATMLDVQGQITTRSNLFVANNITVSNTFLISTNANTPTPVAGLGTLWNSNSVLYWVTSTKTNVISDGR